MAEADPIQRMKAAARRASGPVTVETQRNWYFDELERDLGRDPSGTKGWQLPEPSRGARLLRLILKLIALAAAVFALTATVMLWRNGAFSGLMPEAPKSSAEKRGTFDGIAEPPPPERGSQIPEGKDAPPNLVEPPAPPPQARVEEQADEPAEEGE